MFQRKKSIGIHLLDFLLSSSLSSKSITYGLYHLYLYLLVIRVISIFPVLSCNYLPSCFYYLNIYFSRFHQLNLYPLASIISIFIFGSFIFFHFFLPCWFVYPLSAIPGHLRRRLPGPFQASPGPAWPISPARVDNVWQILEVRKWWVNGWLGVWVSGWVSEWVGRWIGRQKGSVLSVPPTLPPSCPPLPFPKTHWYIHIRRPISSSLFSGSDWASGGGGGMEPAARWVGGREWGCPSLRLANTEMTLLWLNMSS